MNKYLSKSIIAALLFFCLFLSQGIAQDIMNDAEAAKMGLKKPKNISEAQTLMNASYKECMRAIQDFGNDKISGNDSDEKLKIYMYYKTCYDKMLLSANASNSETSGETETGNTNNNGNDQSQQSNQNNQLYSDKLPYSELVSSQNQSNSQSKKGFFAQIFDSIGNFFGGLFGSDSSKDGILNVPLRSQLDSANGANGLHYCAPTCLAMVLEYQGIKLSTKEVAKLCNTDTKGTTYSDDMLAAAKKLGMSGSFSCSGANINWLSQTVNSGVPVIVYVDTKSYGMADGHCMVVVGVKDGYVYVNDPWTGKQLRYGTWAFNAIWTTRSFFGLAVKK